MDTTSPREIHKALAERLAHRRIGDDVLKKVSDQISRNGLKVGGMDFCPYGICVDYFSDKMFSVDELVRDMTYRELRLFVYGIPVDDLFRLRLEVRVPELQGVGVGG
jgi:hypothetical protein